MQGTIKRWANGLAGGPAASPAGEEARQRLEARGSLRGVLVQKVLPPVLVFALAAFVYGLYGLHGELDRDNAIYLYSGQRMAEGVPHYVSIFDNKGPLSAMLAGWGVAVSRPLGLGDLYGARLLFFAIGCGVVASVYLLGEALFRSRRAALFAALTFLGFFWFARGIAGGPQEKIPMVLFATLSLLLTSRRRWFWAGLCGSLSLLVWQPTGLFALATLLLAAAQPPKRRPAAVGDALAGVGAPLVGVGAYFAYHHAFSRLVDALVVFHLLYGERPAYPLLEHLVLPVRAAYVGFSTMFVPILIGLLTIVRLHFSRGTPRRSFRELLAEEAFAPVVLTFPALVVWSLVDFQGPDDFLVLLPYAAVGFGRFLDLSVRGAQGLGGGGGGGGGAEASAPTGATKRRRPPLAAQGALTVGLCACLVAVAVAGSRSAQMDAYRKGFELQRRGAAEIQHRFGGRARLVSLGAPQVLALLHRTNPNPYAFVESGIDNYIAARTPGGFGGWVGELKAYDPDVIAFGKTKGAHARELMDWVVLNYHLERVGPWELFVRNSVDK